MVVGNKVLIKKIAERDIVDIGALRINCLQYGSICSKNLLENSAGPIGTDKENDWLIIVVAYISPRRYL